MLLLHSGNLIDMFFLPDIVGAIPILQLLLQLLNLSNKALLILLIHLSIFLQLTGCLDKFHLKLLTTFIRLSEKPLILLKIVLQVINNCLLLLKTNQDAKLIVQFNLFLLE